MCKHAHGIHLKSTTQMAYDSCVMHRATRHTNSIQSTFEHAHGTRHKSDTRTASNYRLTVYVGTKSAPYCNASLTNPFLPSKTTHSFPFSALRHSASPPTMIPTLCPSFRNFSEEQQCWTNQCWTNQCLRFFNS